jgi:anthranilate phosphoribosyltransferase
MIKDIIQKLVLKQDLSEDEARRTMEFIMGGEATPAQIAAFITALRMKGETVDEITGCARAMRGLATHIEVKGAAVALESDGLNSAEEAVETVVDTCGTGGDGANTFNISTAVALVAAGSGLTVAKHGNRAISSRCGSADVLEALGVNLSLSPEQVRACIAETGIGFLFAPLYHLAMKHAGGVRKEIGIRTIFNLLGPLANPAGANVQVLGVYEKELTARLAEVLLRLGLRRAMVVHGSGTLDEFSLFGPTQVSEVNEGRVKTYSVTPADFGLPEAQPGELAGADAAHNAQLVRSVLAGEPGAKLDAVLMNAAAVFVVAGKARGFKQGVELARETIVTGKARGKLEQLAEVTGRLALAPPAA